MGVLIATGAAVVRPQGFVMLASAGACFAAFGLWGIVDRELSERRAEIGTIAKALLSSARIATAILGLAAGLALLYGALAVTLGTWIS